MHCMYLYTDPQGCGCGFMTLERMYRLLGITMTTGGGARTSGTGRQFIFPDIGFTCSGKVVKWIVGGRWSRNERGDYSQLQIWRPSGNGVYHRLNGTTISTAVERGNNVYEFIADPPIPFRSGDIVGVFQPQRSKLRVDYDTEGGSLIYHISVGSDEVMSSHITIDTSDGNLRTATALPFVSVEIGEFVLPIPYRVDTCGVCRVYHIVLCSQLEICWKSPKRMITITLLGLHDESITHTRS